MSIDDLDLFPVEPSDRRAARIRLAKLESDLAYFQTRLELIGELNSSHRLAQRKAFNQLIKATARQILAAKRNQSEPL